MFSGGIKNTSGMKWVKVILPYRMCEKCPNTEFFLFRISRNLTEYGNLRSKSPYSVRIWENKDQKKPRIWIPFLEISKTKKAWKH